MTDSRPYATMWLVSGQLDAEERVARAVRDVEMAAGDFAVLTRDARTVSEAIRVRVLLGRLVLVLQAQENAASLKAETLCR